MAQRENQGFIGEWCGKPWRVQFRRNARRAVRSTPSLGPVIEFIQSG
jgi:hypothetical protein